ncbi:MAG: hypothetical protein FJW47_05300 [Actinobacteria bacterium]|nr:hypothetical protein [Actinomycetota bacterium]
MKFRILAISVVAVFGTSAVVIPTAQASTIKNGVQCTKVNATKKVGAMVYRCGKNPYVAPTRLTWTLRDCFTANALLKSAKSQYEGFKDIAKLAGADGEKTINELQASITGLENMMKNEACKKGA